MSSRAKQDRSQKRTILRSRGTPSPPAAKRTSQGILTIMDLHPREPALSEVEGSAEVKRRERSRPRFVAINGLKSLGMTE